MQGAIGLGAKANGLGYALLATSWILNQMIVMVFAWSLKALHAFHSTRISIAANQVCTLVLLHSDNEKGLYQSGSLLEPHMNIEFKTYSLALVSDYTFF